MEIAYFLACGSEKELLKILSLARSKIANELKLINDNEYAFCWIVDYPMFEIDENTKKIKFSHNPFFNASRKHKRFRFIKTIRH